MPSKPRKYYVYNFSELLRAGFSYLPITVTSWPITANKNSKINQSEHEAKTTQARENMQLVPSAGKHVNDCKRGKMSAAVWCERTYDEL